MGLKRLAKSLSARIAESRVVRSGVANLVYPTIVRCLRAEIGPDVVSPSGLMEAIAWKAHAYLVLQEELRPQGVDCAADGMRSDGTTRTRIIDVILDRIAPLEGSVLEFGVYNGESLLIFADRCPSRQVYGFDSFEGLPEEWWTRPKGAFRNTIPIPERPNLTLVPGLFDESLPRFLGTWTGPAALVHVDCDLYRSTMACLTPLVPHCRVGTVILFDEYYNYPDFTEHEWVAWREVRSRYGIVAPCIAYDGRRAAFQITALNPGVSTDAPGT
jgi:Methyltransferase domain